MSLRHGMRHQLRGLGLSALLLLGVLLAVGQAQVPSAISPDGTLGTTVSHSGNVYNIMGGTRPGNGPNLFHSFDRFSVGTGNTASFSGPTGIANILSRVTGGQPSLIDGRLQSTLPGANLYLLNPSGVMFGPNATLDISGSFHVSTADVLRLADGGTFAAHLGAQSVLTVAPPAAFGFLGNTPAPIAVHGSFLQVSEGKALSVIGGDVQIVGGELVAPSGRIQLASVGSPGEVHTSPLEMEPDLQTNTFARLGRLTLSQNALLDVSGNGGGTVLIRSSRLLVDQSAISADTIGNVNGARKGIDIAVAEDIRHTQGGFITAESIGGNAGDIQIKAGNLYVEGALIAARTFLDGRAGDIRIDVGTLTLTGGAQIDTSTFGRGHGGTLTVLATEAISIRGSDDGQSPTGLFSLANGSGDASRLFVSTPLLEIAGGRILTRTLGEGNAGDLDVRVGRLTLSEGGQIFSGTGLAVSGGGVIGSSAGSGRGGTLTVMATDAIFIAGHDQEGFASGLFSDAQIGQGKAGNLFITAPRLTLDDGGMIAAMTSDPSSGAGGNIAVQVGRLTLMGGAQISTSTSGSGDGGALRVEATDAISLTGHSNLPSQTGLFSLADRQGNAGQIFVSAPTLDIAGGRILTRTLGEGHAGDLEVRVGRLTLSEGGQIFSGIGQARSDAPVRGSPAGSGRGGTLTVMATDAISIAGHDQTGFASGLFSTAQIGTGKAGNLFITTPRLTLDDGGMIEAATTDSSSGAGGNIAVQVGRLTLTGEAQISSSTSGSGDGGTLRVEATDTISITGNGSRLPQTGLFSLANGQGNAGQLFVSAPTLDVTGGRILTRTRGEGNAGDLEVRVGRLTLSEGGQIFSGTGIAASGGGVMDSIAGPGRGGTLTVMATDSISIAGHDQAGFASGLFSTAQIGQGKAGNLFITTPRLTLDDGGMIEAATTDSSSGAGGNIAVHVGRLTLTGGAQISSSTSGAGRGGNIALQAQHIMLRDEGTISARSTGKGDTVLPPGNAGNIVLQAGQTFQSHNGFVTAAAAQADGGDIQFTVGSRVELRDSQITTTVQGREGNGGNIRFTVGSRIELRDSQITTAVQGGEGRGGDITIDPQFVILQRSNILANAFGGPGGNIRLVAQGFLVDTDSRVDASSALNVDGTVDIQAFTNPSGLVAPLAPDFASVAALLRDQCAARLREGTVSSLVERKRDGVPASPEGVLPSRLVPGLVGTPRLTPEGQIAPQGQRPARDVLALDRVAQQWRLDCSSR